MNGTDGDFKYGSSHELDLSTGEIHGPSGGVVHWLENWGNRQRILSTEIYLSTANERHGLTLFELGVIWPGWFKSATSLQHIRIMFGNVLCLMNASLRPFGWMIKSPKKSIRFSACAAPERGLPDPMRVTALRAINHLRAAQSACQNKEYSAALNQALAALRLSGVSLQARLIIGACCFCHGQGVDTDLATDTADYLLQYEKNLRSGRDKVSVLRNRQIDKNFRRWNCADDFVGDCDIRLAGLSELFERARGFLLYGWP